MHDNKRYYLQPNIYKDKRQGHLTERWKINYWEPIEHNGSHIKFRSLKTNTIFYTIRIICTCFLEPFSVAALWARWKNLQVVTKYFSNVKTNFRSCAFHQVPEIKSALQKIYKNTLFILTTFVVASCFLKPNPFLELLDYYRREVCHNYHVVSW